MHMTARTQHSAHSSPLFADALLAPAACSDAALAQLDAASRWFTTRRGTDQMAGVEGFHAVGGALHAMSLALARAELAGVPRAAIRDAVAGVRAVLAASPFARHIQEWPRGYMGDFEVIGQIIGRVNLAPPGTIAYWVEEHALHSPVTQQHRNKVQHQSRQMIDLLARQPDARILVVACGTAPDLRLVPRPLLARATVVLNDADADALARCRADLHDRAASVTFVGGNLFGALRRLRALGPYDLVLAGGLFDYLPDKAAVTLLRAVRSSLLAPSGQCFFTNIATGNPFRGWCEYLATWSLIERSPDDVQALVEAAGWAAACLEVTRDETGLALLVTVGDWRAATAAA